jgi:hypothetical protein
LEIEKVLKHSNKLYDFIADNLSMYETIKECCEEVKELKSKKELLKNKFIVNSAKSIQLGMRKKSIEQSITYMKHLKSLKEISDVLKLLSNNSSKLLISYGLIEKGKSIINLYKNKNIKLLKTFEEEYTTYTNKITDKLTLEFTKEFKEGLKNLVVFEVDSKEEIGLNTLVRFLFIKENEEYNFDISLFKYEGIAKALKEVQYNSFDFKDLIDSLNLLQKMDSDFYSKLRNIITQSFYDELIIHKERLAKFVLSIDNK